MLLMGLIYAWSIFVAPLEVEFGWDRTETSLIFSISMIFFCLGGLAGGFLRKRFSFRWIMLFSGSFILAGFLLASRTVQLWQIFIAYGVFCGFGVGVTYNCLISTLTAMFERKGLISGLLLFAFGLGGMVLGALATGLINSIGWRNTFMAFGIGDFVLIFIGAMLIREQVYQPTAQTSSVAGLSSATAPAMEYSPMEMIKSKTFLLYMLWVISCTVAGLMLVAHAGSIALDQGLSSAYAAFMVGLLSVSNGFGRILTGISFDRKGFPTSIVLSCVFGLTGSLLLLLYFNTSILAAFIAGCIVVGFMYGSAPTLSASFVRSRFGNKNFALNFSITNLNLIISSSIGPTLAGSLRTQTGNYTSSMVAMLGFVIFMSIMAYFLIRDHQKAQMTVS